MSKSGKYQKMILDTINETYHKYQREKILKAFAKHCLISEGRDLLSSESLTVDISDVTDTSDNTAKEFNQIQKVVEVNCKESIRLIEELEYKTPYKYASLFEVSENILGKISELIMHRVILNSADDEFNHDSPKNIGDIKHLNPTYKEIDSNIIALKFSDIVSGYLPGDSERRAVKYPILALIYKDINILEIRFDSIKNYLKNGDDNFYVKKLNKVKKWFETIASVNLVPISLSPIIDSMARNDSKEVDVAAQAMNLVSGSRAILDTGYNDRYVLPLLGELKELIQENEVLFQANDQTLKILRLLDNFIFETEETSDLPWISLVWKSETKSKSIRVKFSFNYKGQDCDVLQYYGNNAEMERMNNVTRYLIKNRLRYESEIIESAN